jgi:hypothetical protein
MKGKGSVIPPHFHRSRHLRYAGSGGTVIAGGGSTIDVSNFLRKDRDDETPFAITALDFLTGSGSVERFLKHVAYQTDANGNDTQIVLDLGLSNLQNLTALGIGSWDNPGGGGSQYLYGLLDVDSNISGAADGDLLVARIVNGNAQWTNISQSAITPDLTGYATQSWVNSQGFLKGVSWGNVAGKPDTFYTLPTASENTKGGVKVGTGLVVSSDVLSLAATGVTAGAYTKVSIDAYGRATSGAALSESDIPALSVSKITGLSDSIDSKLNKSAFDDLFEKVQVNGIWSIKAKYGLWTGSFLTALDSGGSGGSGGGTGGLIQDVYGYGNLGQTFDNNTLTDTFNAYTINAIYNRVVSLESNASGSLSNYLPLSGGTMSGYITFPHYAHLIQRTADTSNYVPCVRWKNASDTLLGEIGMHNVANKIFLNPVGSADVWNDAVGKYSLAIGLDYLTYNTYPVFTGANSNRSDKDWTARHIYAYPTSGAGLKVDAQSYPWSYITLAHEGTVAWDIASHGTGYDGHPAKSLEFRYGGSTTVWIAPDGSVRFNGGTFTGTLRMEGAVISAGESQDDGYGFINVCRSNTINNAACFSWVRQGVTAFALGFDTNSNIVMGSANYSGGTKTVNPWMTLSGTGVAFTATTATLNGYIVLNADNYNDYTVTKTGGGASGNWGINAVGLSSTGFGDNNLTYLQTPDEFMGNSGWSHYIVANHGDGASYYNFTLALPFYSAPKYSRQYGSVDNRSAWYNFYTEENANSLNFNWAADVLNANRVCAGWDSGYVNSISCSNWFRSCNATGWYNSSYNGGIFMEDTGWVKIYGDNNFYIPKGLRVEGAYGSYGSNNFNVLASFGNSGLAHAGIELAASDNVFGIGVQQDDIVYFWGGVSTNVWTAVGKGYMGYINLVNKQFLWEGAIVSNGAITALATSTSDMRLKCGFEELNGLHTMKAIGKAFLHRWNDLALSLNPRLDNNHLNPSWSAQQVMECFPVASIEGLYGEYLGINREVMVPVLWNAVIEVDDEVSLLKKRVSELEYRLSKYEAA